MAYKKIADARTDADILAGRETLQLRYKRVLHYIKVFFSGDVTMAGELLIAILLYGKGEEPEFADESSLVRLAFEAIRPDLDADSKKYIDVSRKRASASRKRWSGKDCDAKGSNRNSTGKE